jgi:hypothetical protein
MTSLLLLLSLVFAQAPAIAPPPSPSSLSQAWEAEHRDYGPTPLLDHAALQPWLETTVKESGGAISIEEIGRSLEGRSISHLTVGRGPFHVLLWSQMHGDEPTATSALLDILHHVNRRRSSPEVQRLLESLTLHIVPMLNPDGAQRFQRRNAQGIDINRDALLLQTPEGRILKALRDRLNPSLGFNLHNQGWRTSAGKSGKPASISLLAVAFDEPRTETPGRVLAKKACAIIRGALETFVPGQVARYDDEFEVRAFGDNVTKWGTPVVLIETGPLGGAQADRELVRLNFVAILAALDAVASGVVHKADPAAYETLPINESGVFTILVRGATIATGTAIPPFLGDVGLASSRVVRAADERGPRRAVQSLRIEDLGDLRVFSGLETIDAAGLVLAPSQGWKAGDAVSVPEWSAFRSERVIATGSALDLALLKETGKGTYRVDRIIPSETVLGGK